MKKKSQTIFATITLLSICLSVLVYMYYYNPKLKEAEELKGQNDQLKVRVDQLEKFNEEMPTNLEKIAEAETSIKAKLSEFPSEVREEDIIYLALRTLGEVDDNGNLIAKPVEETEETDNKKKKDDEEIEVVPIRYTAINPDSYEELAVIPADTVKKAEIEGLQKKVDDQVVESDVKFEYRTVSYTSNLTYEGLKNAIDIMNKNSEKLAVNKVAFSVNKEKGILEGTFEVIFYSVEGTAKEYKERKLYDYETGLSDLFRLEGVVEAAPDQDDQDDSSSTGNDDSTEQ